MIINRLLKPHPGRGEEENKKGEKVSFKNLTKWLLFILVFIFGYFFYCVNQLTPKSPPHSVESQLSLWSSFKLFNLASPIFLSSYPFSNLSPSFTSPYFTPLILTSSIPCPITPPSSSQQLKKPVQGDESPLSSPPLNKPALTRELPIPHLRNSLIVSIEHSVLDSVEVGYIKKHFNWGLYTWLAFSKTALVPVLDWHTSWEKADQGLESFKNQVNQLIQAAKAQNVRLHIVLVGGIVRYVSTYKEAKEEDIRNCQWYNDNKLASDTQITDPDAMNKYIWGTLSRYARKMRRNLEAKAKAALAFLKQKMDENPDLIVAISGWGEVELNYHRIIQTQSIQDYFCDYSPFAVLEFRDWILHAGMYDDESGKYAGQGWSEGGAKYQGASGLAKFNQEFGTNFTTWDLKYYHWSLNDEYDTDPTDKVNNDPHRIPWENYKHGQMMPTSGPDYIAGGFDPPRVMQPGDKFWDLWNLFRETMVHHYVLDMAQWAEEAGIPAERFYSHQIPADYLFGTNPDMANLNPRYYTSASPLWTADIQPYGSVGATIYDIKFPPEVNPNEFVRTTQYALEAVSEMADNWAIMEYDAETYPEGLAVEESSVADILSEYLKVYRAKPHLINFFRWQDNSGEHQIKGKNKEKALRQFIARIRDKARRVDLEFVFDPPQVIDFQGQHDSTTNYNRLWISGRIWSGHPWKWKQWGDFDHFEIFRGETADFPLDENHKLAETSEYSYVDKTAKAGQTYYYRIRAVNVKGVAGPASWAIQLPREDVFILDLRTSPGGTTSPSPGLYSFDKGIEVEVTALPNEGYFFFGWGGDASGQENPLRVLMDRDKVVIANFKEKSVFPPLNFQGQKVINRSLVLLEYVNYLTWEANPANQNVVAYRIYLVDEGGGPHLLVELSADVFSYSHRGVAKDKEYIYYLTAVDNWQVESEAVTVRVK